MALALVASGCGDDDEAGDEGPLGYLPADAAVVLELSTDLESEQWQALEQQLLAGPLSPESVGDSLDLGPLPPPTSLDGFLRQAAAFTGLSWDDQIEPLLGGDRVVAQVLEAVDEAQFVAALDTGDEDLARSVLEELELTEQDEHEGAAIFADESGTSQVALDGDVLVVTVGIVFEGETVDGLDPALTAAIDRERDGTGLDPEALDREGLDPDALLRLHSDLAGIRELAVAEEPRGAKVAALPWIAALETLDATLSVSADSLSGAAVVSTEPDGLSPEDLPLPVDAETPELVRREGEISGASADQSQTTTFLYDLVRVGFPDSHFVRDVATLERRLGIDFVAEFLEQFSGPSASALPLSDEFAARSEVADPEAMAATLRELAPDVGRLVQDLQGLQGRGLIPLFLLAPDAPIAPGVLGASRIEVSAIPGEPDLYLISELIPPGLEPVTPLPREIVFGLLDDVFVVASDLERAREIAAAPSEPPPEGVEGASIVAGDLAPLRARIEEAVGVDPGPLGELTGQASATTAELRASATVELP